MIEITGGLVQLRGFIQSTTSVTVVDFFATWCAPCQRAKPIYHQLANSFTASHPGQATFCTCDADVQKDCAREYRVTGLPTFIIFHAGGELWRDHSVDALNRALDVHIAAVRRTSSTLRRTTGGELVEGDVLSGTAVKGVRDPLTAKLLQLQDVMASRASSSSSGAYNFSMSSTKGAGKSQASAVEGDGTSSPSIFPQSAFVLIESIKKILQDSVKPEKPFGTRLLPFLGSFGAIISLSQPNNNNNNNDGGGGNNGGNPGRHNILELLLSGMRQQESRTTATTGRGTIPFSSILVENILRYLLTLGLDLVWTDKEEIDFLYRAFRALLLSPTAEQIIAKSPFFLLPSPGVIQTGKELEYNSLLGAFFGLGPTSRLANALHGDGAGGRNFFLSSMMTERASMTNFFPSTAATDLFSTDTTSTAAAAGEGGRGGRRHNNTTASTTGALLPTAMEIQLKEKEISSLVDTLSLRNMELVKVLLSSRVLRAPTLRFFSLALKLNEGHERTVFEDLPLSSPYVLIQIQIVLLKMAKPIFDPYRDVSIYASRIAKEERDEREEEEGGAERQQTKKKKEWLLEHPIAHTVRTRFPPSYLLDDDPAHGNALISFGKDVERVMRFDEVERRLPSPPHHTAAVVPPSSSSSSSPSLPAPTGTEVERTGALPPSLSSSSSGASPSSSMKTEEEEEKEVKERPPRSAASASPVVEGGGEVSPSTASSPPPPPPPPPEPASLAPSSDSSPSPPNTSPSPFEVYKPAVHLFFLAIRALTTITIPMIRHAHQMMQERDSIRRRYGRVGTESAAAPAGEATWRIPTLVRQQYYALEARLCLRTGFLASSTHTSLHLSFLNDLSFWLLCVTRVDFLTGSLPRSPVLEWEYLPQMVVDTPINGCDLVDLSGAFLPHLNGLLLILMGNRRYFPKPHTHVFSHLLLRLLQHPNTGNALQQHPWFSRHIVRSCMYCYVAVEKAYYERLQVRFDLSSCLKKFLDIPSLSSPVQEEMCDPNNPTLEQFSHMAVAELNEAIDQMVETLKQMNAMLAAKERRRRRQQQEPHRRNTTTHHTHHPHLRNGPSSEVPSSSGLSAEGSTGTTTTSNGQRSQPTRGGGELPVREEEEYTEEEEEEEEEEGEEDEVRGAGWDTNNDGAQRRTTNRVSYHELGSRLSSYISLFFASTDLFVSLARCFPSGVSQNMVAQQLAQVLARSLVTFAGPQSSQLKIVDGEKYKFEPRRILSSLVSCLIPLSEHQSFLRCLCESGVSREETVHAIDRVVSRQLVSSVQQMHLNLIKDAILQLAASVEEEQQLWEDAPDFVLDAILSTPLLEPIALPAEVKDLNDLIFVNKKTIHHFLLSDSKHPFTKEYLDEEMLRTFNEKPEVITAVKKREEAVKEWLRVARKEKEKERQENMKE